MYLANDVIQNSKRKGPEYGKEFSKWLPEAFKHIHEHCAEDTKMLGSLGRILKIWEDRVVYEAPIIDHYRKRLAGQAVETNNNNVTAVAAPNDEGRKRRSEEAANVPSKKSRKVEAPAHNKSEIVVEVNGTKETHVTLSPHTSFGDPPEPEELIKAMQSIENAASSDITVRQKIANLPLELSDVAMLSKLEDKEAALKLSREVADALKLLNDYNARLCREMEDRKKLQTMLKDFAQEQKELLTQAEARLEVSAQEQNTSGIQYYCADHRLRSSLHSVTADSVCENIFGCREEWISVDKVALCEKNQLPLFILWTAAK